MGTHIGNLHGVDEPSPARELVAGSARQRVAVVEHHTAIGSDAAPAGMAFTALTPVEEIGLDQSIQQR
jgi:hypothetical protein